MRLRALACLLLAAPAAADPPVLEIEYEVIRPSDAQTRYEQSFGVDLNSAPGRFAVGANHAYDTDYWLGTGGAYVYEQGAGGWIEGRLIPSDAMDDDLVGESIALPDGGLLVGTFVHSAGALSSGAVWSFRRTPGGWVEEQKLLPPDLIDYAYFGFDMDAEGDRALISATQHGALGGLGAGAVYAFRYDGSGWVHAQTLTASDAEPNDRFGVGVEMSGDVAVVGALATWTSFWRGVAYVFRFDGARWIEEAILRPTVSGSGFGNGDSIAIDADRILLGAPDDRTKGTRAGSAYVFRYEDSEWVEEARLYASDAAPEHSFGHAVALSGGLALVSARTPAAADGSTGSVYLFRFDGTTWVEHGKLDLPQREESDFAGSGGVRLDGGSGTIAARNKAYRVEIRQPAQVDIRPYQAANRIDPRSAVPVVVAVRGSTSFDVSEIAWETLRFGPAGTPALSAPLVVDADGDGFDDLLSRHSQRDAGIAVGDTEACLSGQTQNGIPFSGCDGVLVGPSCGQGFQQALLLPGVILLGRLRRSARRRALRPCVPSKRSPNQPDTARIDGFRP
jgi:hypothetical protein